MNINLRALVFGAAVAAALTVTISVFAAEAPRAILLPGIEVVAHRAASGAAPVDVVRLDPVVVTARKAAV